MNGSDFWDMEQKFWLDGEEYFRAKLSNEALMVFQPPVGILCGNEIIETLKEVPRWDSVEISEKKIQQGARTSMLAYRAFGKRNGESSYQALCSSAYVKIGDEWKMVLHHQTPIE